MLRQRLARLLQQCKRLRFVAAQPVSLCHIVQQLRALHHLRRNCRTSRVEHLASPALLAARSQVTGNQHGGIPILHQEVMRCLIDIHSLDRVPVKPLSHKAIRAFAVHTVGRHRVAQPVGHTAQLQSTAEGAASLPCRIAAEIYWSLASVIIHYQPHTPVWAHPAPFVACQQVATLPRQLPFGRLAVGLAAQQRNIDHLHIASKTLDLLHIPQRKRIVVAYSEQDAVCVARIEEVGCRVTGNIASRAVVVVPVLAAHKQRNANDKQPQSRLHRTTCPLAAEFVRNQCCRPKSNPNGEGIERKHVGVVAFARLIHRVVKVDRQDDASHQKKRHH